MAKILKTVDDVIEAALEDFIDVTTNAIEELRKSGTQRYQRRKMEKELKLAEYALELQLEK